MPKPPAGGLAGRSPPPGKAQLDRCSIKQKRKNDQTVVPPGGGTVEDNSHPDQSIWGESSLHQTRGAPQRVQNFVDEAGGDPVAGGHRRLLRRGRGGWMSGTVPVPVAGFQPWRGR